MVGVVLTLVLVGLLAASAGAFLIGAGGSESQRTSTTAAVSFDHEPSESGDALAIRHGGGGVLDTDAALIEVSGAACSGVAEDPNGRRRATDVGLDRSTIAAGTTFSLDGNRLYPATGAPPNLSDASVRVLLVAGARTTQLGAW